MRKLWIAPALVLTVMLAAPVQARPDPEAYCSDLRYCSVQDPRDTSDDMRLDIKSASAQFGRMGSIGDDGSIVLITFTIESYKPFTEFALDPSPDAPYNPVRFELHFLADSIDSHRGWDVNFNVMFDEEHGSRYVWYARDYMGVTIGAGNPVRPTPTTLSFTADARILPQESDGYAGINTRWAVRYQWMDRTRTEVLELDRVPDGRWAGPTSELD